MRYPLLVLAAALMAGTTEARADMIYYNMSGIANGASFQWIPSGNGPPPPVSKGDHITWTLQYDKSLPGTSEPQYSSTNYSTNGLTITNLVDQTSGVRFPTLSSVASTLSLYNDPPKKNSYFYASTNGNNFSESYETQLQLNYNGSFPAASWPNWQPNSVPLNLSTSSLQYRWGDSMEGIFFSASVNSMSTPVQGAPEPGSLTLFLLGVASLVTRRIRHLCPV